MMLRRILLTIGLSTLAGPAVFAQAAAEPPKLYTGSFGGGVAITSGNTDTKNFNLALNVVRDPKTKNVIKTTAAYLRGTNANVTNLDRNVFNLRDEYTVSGRLFVFGQIDYLRDNFKEVIFLWSPAGGVGYKLVDSDRIKFEVDGGAGGIMERNPGIPSRKSGSVLVSESFRHKISSTATITEAGSTISKTQNFSDYLTNISAGLTTSVAKKLELKFEFVDNFKNEPPSALVKKNDTAFLTSLIMKF